MSTISKPFTFTTGIISATEMNDNFDTVYTEVNGNLDGANIKDGGITNAELDPSVSSVTRYDENFQDHVLSGFGCTDAGLIATVAIGTAYVKGVRVVTTAASSKTLVNGETFYCDVSSTGTYTWTASTSTSANSIRLWKAVAAAGSLTLTDLRKMKPVNATEMEANAATKIDSATITTNVTSTNTVSTVILTKTVDVLNGDVLSIHGNVGLQASTTCSPTISIYVSGVQQAPARALTIGDGAYTRIGEVLASYTATTDSTALPVEFAIAAAATTTTCTAVTPIVNIIRSRR